MISYYITGGSEAELQYAARMNWYRYRRRLFQCRYSIGPNKCARRINRSSYQSGFFNALRGSINSSLDFGFLAISHWKFFSFDSSLGNSFKG